MIKYWPRSSSTIGLILIFALCACTSPKNEEEASPLPNIIYILADDLGYGDLSCLNEESKINTKHLDALAAEGMVFTDAHSGSSVCTPTRYGILTGRYAWRSRLKKGVTWSYDKHLIPPERMTVASLLKNKGYHTACIGKWHLGFDWKMDTAEVVDFFHPIANGPNTIGFDYFFGITASLDIPPYFYIENDQITAKTIDTIDAMGGKKFWRKSPIGDDFKHIEVLPKFTEKAVTYINQQAKSEDPFFLYFPLPAPHTPILPTAEFQGKSGTNEYGDFVLMVDDVVGQVMKALEINGIKDNTLIVFTSDNGCSPMADFEELAKVDHDPSFVFRGHKADIFEGGHRVPFILRWPEQAIEGGTSNQTLCLTDFLRTCAAIVGDSLPANAGEDSYNFLPLLSDPEYNQPLRESVVHHSINGSFSIRQGAWKLNFCPGSGGWSAPRPKKAVALNLPPVQLYNLKSDIGETKNMAEEYPEVVQRLNNLMTKYIKEGRSTPGEKQANEGETTLSLLE